ncbi:MULTISPECIES: hypothetical protein [unclassified Microbacterium]|uniref:hypothetical protein n=1 Tax=unclassified Microbacterium TaxID=2609290 RepID=UPI003017B436
MSQDPQTPPPAPPAPSVPSAPPATPPGGWVQTTPGAPPQPAPYAQPAPPYAQPAPPYTQPAEPAPPFAQPTRPLPPYAQPAPQPTQPSSAPLPTGTATPSRSGVPGAPADAATRPAMLGILALSLALAAVTISIVLSGATGFAAAEGAMRHAIGISPSGLEDLSEQQLLSLLSPVRGLVLWAEIGYWIGTGLGLAALVTGIAAIATRRGRAQGIAAVVIAAVGPFVFTVVVGICVLTGIGAGASGA